MSVEPYPVGVHLLTVDALRQRPPEFSSDRDRIRDKCDPSLMVENTPEEVGDLLGALSHHEGELTQCLSPRSARLDARQRRLGAEVVGDRAAAPDFAFATLYRVSRWTNRQAISAWEGGKMLPGRRDNQDTLFPPTA